MATTATKRTTASGFKGSAKHLAKTSPATERAVARHEARANAAGRPVARLVKR
jgi:hypothetical protein